MIRKIIKAHTYFPISSEPFDMPVPIDLNLYHANTFLCVYSVAKDLTVDYTYNLNSEIPLLTPKDKRLKIADIYYLLRSRVFPENPFTAPMELARLGLTEYNPYQIILKTYGIMPMSYYWIKLPGDETTYEEAIAKYNEIMFGIKPEQPEQQSEEQAAEQTDEPAGEQTEEQPKTDGGIEDFLGMS